MTEHITPPRRYRRLIDKVMDRDRDYFERHPDDESYVRPHVPGEFWPLACPEATHVVVYLYGPGVRLRLPVMKWPEGAS
jgi:hypothetical protein